MPGDTPPPPPSREEVEAARKRKEDEKKRKEEAAARKEAGEGSEGSEEEEESEIDSFSEAEDPCEICQEHTNPHQMLACDGCDKGFHLFCLTPPLKEIPDDDWFCLPCSSKTEDGDRVDEEATEEIQIDAAAARAAAEGPSPRAKVPPAAALAAGHSDPAPTAARASAPETPVPPTAAVEESREDEVLAISPKAARPSKPPAVEVKQEEAVEGVKSPNTPTEPMVTATPPVRDLSVTPAGLPPPPPPPSPARQFDGKPLQ